MNNYRTEFAKRILEPKEMEEVEQKAFELLSRKNYKRWMVPLVDDALKYLQFKSGNILDVASGPGLLCKEIASRSKNFIVVGIDNSKHAVKLASHNCREKKNVSFVRANIYNLPFQKDFFDLVICKDSLHHFVNPYRAIKEMIRVSRPGGVIYIQDLRRDMPSYIIEQAVPADTITKKLQFFSTRASFTKKEIARIFRTLRLKHYLIKTRKVGRALRAKYLKINLQQDALKESFQSRYVAIMRVAK